MSDAKLIDSAGIPQFTGKLEQLELDSMTLTAEAMLFRVNGALVHSNFQGLSAFYQAPEAADLFSTTAPVATKTDAFADDLEKVSQALTTYGDEVRPLAARLKSLQKEASSFYCNDVAGDEDWREDKDKVQHNNDLWHDVNTTMDAFWAAERACHNKITALVGGIQLKASDGENSCGTYGYKAEDLNKAESTPWGAPVEREYTGWAAVGHNIKSFVWDGIIVDSVWGTIKGLGTLVGTDGWDAAGQAWTGLAKLATGLAITLSPAGAAYWMAPKDKLPSWLGDSRTAVTETGKALIAYDQWDKNPARAAGAVTFNVITTVATGGVGAAAKSGAAAKAISVAGKAGRLIDPITYIGKAGKLGAVKVGDLFSSLKNLNTGAYNDVLSGQGRLQPDGTVVKIPDRVEILPDGSLKYVADKGETRYLTREGALLDENRKVIVQRVEQVKIQSAASERVGGQGETPALRESVREPAMAGARAGDGAGGAVGRVGDDIGGAGRDVSGDTVSHTRTFDSTSGDGLARGSSGGSEPPSGRGAGAGNGLPDDFVRGSDDVARPDGHADNGAGAADDGRPSARERTPEEQKKVIAEQIRKANDPDQTWFEKNYRSDGHRRDIKTLDENGDELPILAKDSDGSWIAKDSLPPKPSATKTLDPRSPFTRDTVPDGEIGHLDEAASNRKVSNALTNAEQAFKKNPSAANLAELNKAQDAFDTQMPGRPNNSSIAEALGEQATMRHVIPRAFKGAQWIDLPKTPNGANMFDQLYRLDDGTLVIAEAKAPKANPIWRKGAGKARGWMVQQGTRPYIETILFQMEKNKGLVARDGAGNPVLDAAGKPVTNGAIAGQIRSALMDGKLKYVMVKATENPGTYAGARLEHFKID